MRNGTFCIFTAWRPDKGHKALWPIADTLVWRSIPIQPIFLAGRADDLLCVFQDAVSVAHPSGVFDLRVRVTAADLHHVQFVPANPACEDLDSPAGRIEPPSSVLANHGNRKRPLLRSHRKGHPVGCEAVLIDLELFVSRPRKLGAKLLVLCGIAGFNDILALRFEKLAESRRVIVFRRINSGLNGLLRGCECPLAVLWGVLAVKSPRSPGRRPGATPAAAGCLSSQ
jgi:hypothetical protein